MAMTPSQRQKTLTDKYKAAGLVKIPIWVAESEKYRLRRHADNLPETKRILEQMK